MQKLNYFIIPFIVQTLLISCAGPNESATDDPIVSGDPADGEITATGNDEKYPTDEINYYFLTNEQEKTNLKEAHVRMRTRYLNYFVLDGMIHYSYIWQDSFNADGQLVLHRYMNSNGELILSKIYTYDQFGNSLVEQEFPGPHAILGDTTGTRITNTYTYDEQGNILVQTFAYNSNYSKSFAKWEKKYDVQGNMIAIAEYESTEGVPLSTPERSTSISYFTQNGRKVVQQIAEDKSMHERMKLVRQYDLDNFLLKEERFIAQGESDFKIDRTIKWLKDENGRLTNKILYGSNGTVFAEYVYTYSGDTITETYSRKDGNLIETSVYVQNRTLSEEEKSDMLNSLVLYSYNEKGLLVKKENRQNVDFSILNESDTLVYEYYP